MDLLIVFKHTLHQKGQAIIVANAEILQIIGMVELNMIKSIFLTFPKRLLEDFPHDKPIFALHAWGILAHLLIR